MTTETRYKPSQDSRYSSQEFTRDIWNPKPELWQPYHELEANVRDIRFRTLHKPYPELWERLKGSICVNVCSVKPGMAPDIGFLQFTSINGI
jgi:hypothetical protein